jgi:hypothetical protein
MASKSVKVKENKPKLDAHQRRVKTMQTVFVVICAILILSMALSAVAKF